jgi:hypothetical protein
MFHSIIELSSEDLRQEIYQEEALPGSRAVSGQQNRVANDFRTRTAE